VSTSQIAPLQREVDDRGYVGAAPAGAGPPRASGIVVVPDPRQRPRRRFLYAVAAAVLILNLADALFTLLFTMLGAAEEANPLMGEALSSPLRFMLVKLSLVSLGVLLLWRLRAQRAAAAALYASALAYSTVLIYHLSEAHHLVALAP
jgi:hypothetical protein